MAPSAARDPTITQTGARPELSPTPGEFPWRVFSLLNAFRLFIAITLLIGFLAIRDPRIVGEFEPLLGGMALLALLAFALGNLLLLRRRWPGVQAQVYLQFGIDLVTIVALMHASGGIASGLGGLLVVSVGTLSLLIALDRALLLASLTTFVLLAEQVLAYSLGYTDFTAFGPAGILAAVIFVITGIVQLVRNRIVETEALAAQRGVDLQNLVELNEYIIQHLRESIVVVDGNSRVRLFNESSAGTLGVRGEVRGRRLGEIAPTLQARLDDWRQGQDNHSESTFVLHSDDHASNIQPHFARLGTDRQDGVAIFLEDTSLILERVQQTKLAALGRLSASIAHEIRNPLGAMSHAAQLLAESTSLDPDDKRLTDIIRINSERVSRIVESILSLSKSDKTHPERISLNSWLADFADEFTKTQELFEGAIALHPDSVPLDVEMDRTHLHQILWNLCDNAVKYASEAAGAISVELYCGTLESSGRPYLDVIDSGPGISEEMVEQIFEPFYTAQPGGTGLGLYISRELCERNGASLRYVARPEGGSVFRIVFTDPNRWISE